jgi:hydroxypyruvate isomerase
MSQNLSRRSALAKMGSAASLATVMDLSHRLQAAEAAAGQKLKGRINHSVCRWCYSKVSLDDVCRACNDIGIKSVDLMKVEDFPTLKKYGLTCAMVTGVPFGIPKGLNRLENHDPIVKFFEDTLPAIAEFGAPNTICFSGNRGGMSDEQGMENCVAGLKRIAPLAEKHKVNVCMELLNSRHDHKDYMCDRSAWGVEVVKRTGSEYIKLLYDIYHMQIMEGDLCATIRQNHQYFGHFHTGGVPGRHEIDDTQEIHYPQVMRTIVETGYKGFVAQEFVPKQADALASLKRCVEICDV